MDINKSYEIEKEIYLLKEVVNLSKRTLHKDTTKNGRDMVIETTLLDSKELEIVKKRIFTLLSLKK